MAKSTKPAKAAPAPFDPAPITRAQALAALDEPEGNPALAKRLYEQMRAFGSRLQPGRRTRLMVRNDFEEVAAEALARAIAEADHDDDTPPPTVEIARL